MATDKKHIAVYLDPAIEQALIEFCEANGMRSKKGPQFSAAVNKALAQYFQLENPIPDTTPRTTLDNTPGSTPSNTSSTIPDTTLAQRLAEIEEQQAKQGAEIEELRGKLAA